ncbi:interferon-like [Phalacrocorax carbo]|uniref:interferon-like n=1 Tax=Phalacrocorax carbo TaxID=9209 RepID=UPI00311A7BA3
MPFSKTLTTALACHHLHPHDATFLWDSLQLLQAMAPSLPQICHHQHPPFPFPNIFPSTPTTHSKLPLPSTSSSTLFTTPHHWDAQAQHHLLSNISSSSINACQPTACSLKAKGPDNLLLNIKYFRHIQDFLYTHNHSPCAWDHIHFNTHACLHHLHNLTHTMCS